MVITIYGNKNKDNDNDLYNYIMLRTAIHKFRFTPFGIYATAISTSTCIGAVYGFNDAYNDSKHKNFRENVFESLGGCCIGLYCGILFGLLSPVTFPVTASVLALRRMRTEDK